MSLVKAFLVVLVHLLILKHTPMHMSAVDFTSNSKDGLGFCYGPAGLIIKCDKSCDVHVMISLA